MRVILYARVSTTRDQKLEVQLDEMRLYCKNRNFEVVKEITDFGYSGTTDKRPGLVELNKLVKGRKADGVIVLKLDRLFRSLKHLITTLSEFEELGVKFISLKEQIDMTTSSGRLLVGLLGAFAEFEADIIRDRTLLGLDFARKSGKILGRPTKHDPNKIIALRNEGNSYRKIAVELNCPLGVVSQVISSGRKSGKILVGKTEPVTTKKLE